MAARRAWVLNLDADLELASGPRYAAPRRVKDAMKRHVATLAATLVPEDDLVVDETSLAGSARGLRGVAFCVTPGAVSLLGRCGAVPEPHPSVEVLRQVNSRAFATSLGETLPGAAFLRDLDAATALLRTWSPLGPAWRVKHAFGMAGRSQRVIAAGAPTDEDLGFVARGVVGGGVQVEPQVDIEEEYALHGFLSDKGALRLGELVRQRCDVRGAWVSTERLDATDASFARVDAALRDEVERVAAALHGAGYFGPFGVDAYSYRDAAGSWCFQRRSEINARYSMGFAVGFGGAARIAAMTAPPNHS